MIRYVNHLSDDFYRRPSETTQSMTTIQLQETMMETKGSFVTAGYRWTIEKKGLAPGVWLVSAKRGMSTREKPDRDVSK